MYSPDDLKTAEAAFEAEHPVFEAPEPLKAMREADYARLDRLGHTYLDYTGGGLYAESQLAKHHEWLSDHVLGAYWAAGGVQQI